MKTATWQLSQNEGNENQVYRQMKEETKSQSNAETTHASELRTCSNDGFSNNKTNNHGECNVLITS